MNKKLSFVVDMTKPVSNNFAENEGTFDYYKRALVRNVKKLGLTISGEDRPEIRRGVDQAGFGNVLTVGTSRTHDMEWIERMDYVCEKGYTPVLNLIKDWDLISRKLVEYYKDKYQMDLKYGSTVSFHDGFVKIGTELVTNRELDKIIDKLDDMVRRGYLYR